MQTVEVRSVDDFAPAFKIMADSGAEGAVTAPNGLFYQARALVGQLGVLHRLPTMVVSRETLEAGALMSYGADFQAIFRRTPVYMDKILKGEKPGDLPVELPTKFQFLDQSQDGESARPNDFRNISIARRRGDRMMARSQASRSDSWRPGRV